MEIQETGAVTVCGKNMSCRFFSELGEGLLILTKGGRESKTVRELLKRED